MCPLGLLQRLIPIDDEEVPPEFRAQRKLNKARVPEIAAYIIDNRKEYVFSALTVSIDARVDFRPAQDKSTPPDAGVLKVPLNARFVVNDGQHRRAAIEEALKRQPDLSDETIAVVFFIDEGLNRSQQMFADLNKHAVRPTRSLGVLYDRRDPLSQLACQLARDVPIFRDLTEMDKTTISNRSRKLFTLSSIYFATRQLLGKHAGSPVSIEEAQLARDFWIEVSRHVADWQLAAQGEISSAELRRDYIHAHGVALQALALAGTELIIRSPSRWKQKLRALQGIDWSRSNRALWEGRAMIGGRVSKATNNVVLTANVVSTQLGLPLSPSAKQVEELYVSGRQ